VDLYVVSYQKDFWGVQAHSYENEKWFPCRLNNNKTNSWIIMWCWGCMGFICIMLMLEIIHEFIKFAQRCDTFVYGFVKIMKMSCVDLYSLCYDPKNRYVIYFKSFLDLMDCKINGLLIAWWTNPTNNVYWAYFLLSRSLILDPLQVPQLIRVFVMCMHDD
jgi:hypothetical protein